MKVTPPFPLILRSGQGVVNHTMYRFCPITTGRMREIEGGKTMLIKDGWLVQVEDTDIIDGVFVIPDHVQEISDEAFQEYRSSRKIIFSAGASYFAGFNWPFAFCRELECFEVDTRNQEFCAEGGVLFDRERTRLFCYPMKKSDSRYRIPDTVTAIDNCAFRGCSRLKEVIIPPGCEFHRGLGF